MIGACSTHEAKSNSYTIFGIDLVSTEFLAHATDQWSALVSLV
jgi:hypothetical protein